jgi:ATP-dependent protease HslVU (ClpYQ) peptidase subunit
VTSVVGVAVGARGQVEVGSSVVDDTAALDADEAAALVDAEVIAALAGAGEVATLLEALEALEATGTGFELETTAEALLGSTLDPVLDLRVMTVVAIVAA